MEQGLEVGLPSFDVLKSFSEILDGVGKVHQSRVNKASIEVVESIIGLETDSFFKLCKCVVDLVEHHHAVASIGVVLRIFIIESNRSAEVIHGLLVVPSSHEGVTSICMVLGMSGPLIIGRSGLKTGNGLTELLDGSLCISLILLLVVLLQEVFSLVVELKG